MISTKVPHFSISSFTLTFNNGDPGRAPAVFELLGFAELGDTFSERSLPVRRCQLPMDRRALLARAEFIHEEFDCSVIEQLVVLNAISVEVGIQAPTQVSMEEELQV